MTPTAPARADGRSTVSFSDPSEGSLAAARPCFIDGAWTGTPATPVTNPVNGLELAKVPRLSTDETTAAVEAARARIPGLGEAHGEGALEHPAPLVRPDRRQPRRHRADPDLGAGQAAGGSARRSRYRRGLCRVLCGGSAPRVRRDHSLAARRCAHRWRSASRSASCGAITPWNFPVLDDHAKGRRRRWPRAAPWC